MPFVPKDTLFDDIYDFLTSTPTPEDIIAYHIPSKLQQRFLTLAAKERQNQLTDNEQIELSEFLRMNRFLNGLKLKAQQKLGNR